MNVKKQNKKDSKKEKREKKVKKYSIKQLLIIFLVLIIVLASAIAIFLLVSDKDKEESYCSVKFNTNGGYEIDAIDLKCGETISEPNTPEKNGFKFLGWYLNDNQYDFSSKVDNNIVLDAKWEADGSVEIVTVKFDTDGGSTQEDIELEKGTYLVKPVDPTKKGYLFVGWFLNNEEFLFISTPVDKNIILKARWEKETEQKDSNENNNKNNNSSSTSTNDSKEEVSVDNSNKYDDIVKQYSGEWFLSGYEDVVINVSRHESGNTKAMVINASNFDIKNKKQYYTITSSCSIEYDEWESDLKNCDISLKSSSINIGKNKFVRNKGSKNRYDGTYYKESLGTWYMYNQPERQLFIRVTSAAATYTNYDRVCIDYINVPYDIVSNTITQKGQCDLIKSNAFYDKAGITISDGKLYLKYRQEEYIFYKTKKYISPKNVTLSQSNINMSIGETNNLIATVEPSDAYNKGVTWSSSNTSVATVNSSGKVTAVGKGTATITVKTVDGGYIAKCEISVSNPTLKTSGSIGITTSCGSSGCSRGVFAKVTASGGTGAYTYYYIKLYKDGTLIGTTTNTSSNELFISGYSNGSYTMEYEVRDSDGTVKTGTSSSTISGF